VKTPITEKDFIEALNRIAALKDGQIVLACLKDFVNYDGDIVTDTMGTYANGVLRRAYLYLRNRIHPDHLKEIEFNYTREAPKNDRPARATKPSDKPKRTTSV